VSRPQNLSHPPRGRSAHHTARQIKMRRKGKFLQRDFVWDEFVSRRLQRNIQVRRTPAIVARSFMWARFHKTTMKICCYARVSSPCRGPQTSRRRSRTAPRQGNDLPTPTNEKPAKAAGLRQTSRWEENLERAKGLEPSTPTLARSCSTTELHPHPDGGDWSPATANLCQMPTVNATLVRSVKIRTP
jgi:hypothetical protein